MQYDFLVFVQDYQLYHFVEMIIGKDYEIYSVNDVDHYYHRFGINDYFLFDVLTKYLLILDNDFDCYHYFYQMFD